MQKEGGLVDYIRKPVSISKEMKRLNNLFDDILNKDKIIELINDAAKGKKSRSEVKHVLNNIDYYSDKILNMFETGNYIFKPVKRVYISEWEKPRIISISPFYPNRILDHICVCVLKPHIRKSMYQYCIGNVDNRGIVYGKNVVAKKYEKYKYHVKLDIKKFYPSVSSDLLYSFLETKIKDKRFLKFCKAVLSQNPDLPIGAYYSQWLSNYYLQDLDYYIKQELKIPFYIRYVDDMLLCGNNKKQLRSACWKIDNYLRIKKSLSLNKFSDVYELHEHPIDFLGFRFRENGIYLRTKIFKILNKKVKKIRRTKHVSYTQASSLMSYIGWLSQLKHRKLYYDRRIKPIVKKGTLRKIISSYNYRKSYSIRLTNAARALWHYRGEQEIISVCPKYYVEQKIGIRDYLSNKKIKMKKEI